MRLSIFLIALGCGSSGDAPREPAEPAQSIGGEAAASEPVADVEAPVPEEEAAPARAGASGAQDSPPSYACRLERDYNQCIVDRLEGRADTEGDLVLLIQSYRFLGRSDDARRQMEEFIERYPDSPQSQTYRDYLGR